MLMLTLVGKYIPLLKWKMYKDAEEGIPLNLTLQVLSFSCLRKNLLTLEVKMKKMHWEMELSKTLCLKEFTIS